MLTGVNTAKHLYQHWADTIPSDQNKIKYFFGDEQRAPPDHHESNFGMVMSTLFTLEKPENYTVIRMEGELSDRGKAAENYE
jgi:6-phosphogluconolactonase/glucosamine-6-phosphate isomerase/deaminase